MRITDAYTRTTTPYFCMWCMKRSSFPLEHKTLGYICQHCLRPFGPITKPRRVSATPAKPRQAKPPASKRHSAQTSKHARLRNRVGDRDGWVCWLCGQPVDPTELGAHRPTMDHVRRRRHGGKDAMGNLRIAHRSCNMYREGANVQPFAPPIPRVPAGAFPVVSGIEKASNRPDTPVI